MRVKNVQITIGNRRKALRQFAETLHRARQGEAVMPHQEVAFETIDSFRRVLTEKRMELLHLIKQRQPESMYELAQLAGRNLKSVQDDLHLLEKLGLLSLEPSNDERQRVKPGVGFDAIRVEIAI